jgi:hypothetical protein
MLALLFAGADRGTSSMPHFHYAWVIALVTFIVLLVTAGIRATPGVLMVPLEHEFGWNRAVISAAVAINIAAFGAGGIRTVAGDYRVAFWMAGALCVLAGTTFLTLGRRTFRLSPAAAPS